MSITGASGNGWLVEAEDLEKKSVMDILLENLGPDIASYITSYDDQWLVFSKKGFNYQDAEDVQCELNELARGLIKFSVFTINVGYRPCMVTVSYTGTMAENVAARLHWITAKNKEFSMLHTYYIACRSKGLSVDGECPHDECEFSDSSFTYKVYLVDVEPAYCKGLNRLVSESLTTKAVIESLKKDFANLREWIVKFQ